MDMFIEKIDDENNRFSKYYSNLGLEGLVVVQNIGCVFDQGAQNRRSRSMRY
jgi:hypothetical protein